MSRETVAILHAGRIDYAEALDWQHRLVAMRARDDIGDVMLVCEHDPVYTAGRHADVGAHVLGTTGIPVVPTDRGGDVTYHGPGQVVIYPIIGLTDPKGVRGYVQALLDSAVRVAATFGVQARSDLARTGVWVGGAKLAAVGIRVQGGITSHGIAFNVAPRLADFSGIVPCGLADADVCSLDSLGVSAEPAAVAGLLVDEIAEALRRTPVPAALAGIGLSRHAPVRDEVAGGRR